VTTTALRVPRVIAWSGEAVDQKLLFEEHRASGGFRLTHASHVRDTDWKYGVLRPRVKDAWGSGEPLWRMLNSRRQWRYMEQNKCQVCSKPAADPDGRIPWVITETGYRATADAGLTNAPATCRACMPEALALCPQLRKSSAVYTVAAAEPVAVLAETFEPGPNLEAVKTGHNVQVDLDEFARLPYVLATQLVVRLEDLRPDGPP
jgi:hypothetical protein